MLNNGRMLQGYELCLEGAVETFLLDFAVSNGESTLCFQLDWWRTGVELGETLHIVEGSPNIETLRFDRSAVAGLYLAEVEDETALAMVDRARSRIDLYRKEYLAALQQLVEQEPSFDFGPWIATVMARPPVDPSQFWKDRVAKPRERGVIALLTNSGKTVDILAVDAHGNSDTLVENGILATLYGAAWSEYPNEARPNPKQYLDWVYQQSVYGPYQMSEPKTAFDTEALPTAVQRALDLLTT